MKILWDAANVCFTADTRISGLLICSARSHKHVDTCFVAVWATCKKLLNWKRSHGVSMKILWDAANVCFTADTSISRVLICSTRSHNYLAACFVIVWASFKKVLNWKWSYGVSMKKHRDAANECFMANTCISILLICSTRSHDYLAACSVTVWASFGKLLNWKMSLWRNPLNTGML